MSLESCRFKNKENLFEFLQGKKMELDHQGGYENFSVNSYEA